MSRPAAKKELGQHFLVDQNLLGVIGRLAELGSEDVVLEVGPGLGVLTAFLADRTAYVHAVELDQSLEPRLREALEGRGNVELHFGDALRIDLATLEPEPTKLVSNLPYNIATPLIVESLDGLPSVGLWCVLVQREVADRFFAEPSTKAYGAVSVLVQLAAERTGFHSVSRTVFRPRPNVDVHWGDALALDLAAFRPAPTKLVANLPYNVATPIVAESLAGLPSVELWCVMVQREVADRFFAEPSTKAYGADSVLVQLAARRTGFHPVARTVFRPQPNVDSALVAFRRLPLPDHFDRVKTIVEASFAHRRKTLPNSVALAGLAPREQAAAALEAIGRLPETRAEALEPAEFVALAEAL